MQQRVKKDAFTVEIRKVIAGACFLLLAAPAFAGFNKYEVIDPAEVQKSLECKVLQSGRVHLMRGKSAKIDFSSEVASPFKVSGTGTAVLFLDKGQTLEVVGGKAEDANGGYPGILVDGNATLILTGEGKLIARGGSATNGRNGSNGTNAKLNYDDTRAGNGGDGGDGGSGAGAGIGGYGGGGGLKGVRGADEDEVETNDVDSYDNNGPNGNNGNPGANGTNAGSVYLLGQLELQVSGGNGGSGGSKGSNGSGKNDWWGAHSYRVGGGGGGGGGAGGASANGIGGGGGGGGGGGAGGNGGRLWTGTGGNTRHPNGAGGEGGKANGAGHDRTDRGWTESAYSSYRRYGGYGGYGGAQGTKGSFQGFFRDSTFTTFSGTTDSAAVSASSHSAIEYNLTFNEPRRTLTARLGYPLPTDGVTALSKAGYIFLGWYGERDGGGECYYDRDASPALTGYHDVSNKTIYAYWTEDRDVVWVNGVGITAGRDKSGDGWTYDARASTVSLTRKDMTYVITGEDKYGEITIECAVNCTVVASNLTVNASRHPDRSAFRLKPGAKATLALAGENELLGGSGAPSVQVESGESLVIAGDGTLVATTGDIDEFAIGSTAAAIGSRPGKDAGAITISGGRVTATSGGGAGIGGGAGGSDGTLAVLGGYVVATGGRNDTDDYEEVDLFSADIGPGYGFDRSVYSVKSTVDPAMAYLAPCNFRLACNKTDIGPKFYDRDKLPLYCVAFTGLVANAVATLTGVPDGYLPPYEITATDGGAVYLWLPTATEKYDITIKTDDVERRYIVGVNGEHVVAPFASGLRVNGRDVWLAYGPGWTLDESTLVVNLEGGGPFVIDGFAPGVGIEAKVDCPVVLSNATVSSSWLVNKPAFRLADGVSVDMTLVGDNRLWSGVNYAGLEVGAGRSVVIDGTGTLNVKGSNGGAGIGGSAGSPDWGRIEIRGGSIKANGSIYHGDYAAAGIGGGPGGSGGSIFVSGGSVVATGADGSAGIGSGTAKGTNGVATASWTTPGIEISGQGTTVEAHGGKYAAGIGGGDGMSGGNVRILGGTVFAKGGESDSPSDIDHGWGAGIGGGREGDGGTIEVAGGHVTAEGGKGASGIGGGYKGKAGTIRISKGRVKATAGDQSAGIGVGAVANGGEIYIASGTVNATGGVDGGNSIGTAFSGDATDGTTQITGGSVKALYTNPSPVNAAPAPVYPLDIECGKANVLVTNLYLSTATYYGFEGMYTDGDGKVKVWLPASGVLVYPGHVDLEDGTSLDFHYAITDGGAAYFGQIITANGKQVFSAIDMSGTGWSYTTADHVLLLHSESIPVTISGTSSDGAFKVVVPEGGAKEVAFDGFSVVSSSASQFDSPVVVSNKCTLSLAGENVVRGAASYSAGIEVADGAELTISGDGTLWAYGGAYAAGIGSRGSTSSSVAVPGRIVVESGTIYATGGKNAAAVGGGAGNNLGENGILVKGGRVYARGGENAVGIGAGRGKFKIPDNAVSIVGGTVAAYGDRTIADTSTIGASASQSDFVASLGNVVDTTEVEFKSLYITGGSAVPCNVGKALPYPLGQDGARVYSILFTGLEPEESVEIVTDETPDSYSTDGIYADFEGRVCLWLAPTNRVRRFVLNGIEYETPYPYEGYSPPPIYEADVVVTGHTDRVVDGKTCYLVKVTGLAKNSTVAVSGLPNVDVVQKTSSAGVMRVFLPDGRYVFTVDGLTYVVVVDGGPATAVRAEPDTPVGVNVNGTDIAAAIGEGWTYYLDKSELCLDSAATYAISGANTADKVRVVASEASVLELSGLELASKSPFTFSKSATLRGEGMNSITSAGGAVFGGAGPVVVERGTFALKGDVACPLDITGGSLRLDGSSAFAFSNGTERVWCVTLGGFAANAEVGSFSGLCGYDASGIVADADGKVYLWLPDGDYQVSAGGLEFIFIVAGADVDATTARIGITVDGEDVISGHGTGWEYSIATRALSLDESRSYALAGTNVQGLVSVQVGADATVVLSSVCVSANAPLVANGAVSLRGTGFNEVTSTGGSVFGGTGSIAVERGTFAAKGKVTCPLRITGGSLRLDGSATVAFSNGTERVWCVTVGGLEPGAAIPSVTGLSGYDTGDVVADADGRAYFWLPNGLHSFSVGDRRYAAYVDGAPATAMGQTGVTVDGVDVFMQSGPGWSYSSANGIVSLSSASEYVVAGTNVEGKVRISACGGSTVVMSNLCIAADEPISAEGGMSLRGIGVNSVSANGGIVLGGGRVAISSGTFVLSGNVACPVTIFGGSVRLGGFVSSPVSNATERVHCVTVGGFAPWAEVTTFSGIGVYDTAEIYADGGGSIYLWLPDGERDFYAGGAHYYVNVDGYDAEAAYYEDAMATGVLVDGVDAIHLSGSGWTYSEATSNLTVAAGSERIVCGTNVAGRVRIVAEGGAALAFSNLCISADAPFAANGAVSLRGAGFNEVTSDGDAIGGAGSVAILRGTFAVKGDIACAVTVTGGSLRLDGAAAVAVSNGTERVWCVTVGGLEPDAEVPSVTGLSGYDAGDVVADEDGRAYFWLPNGFHSFSVGDRPYAAYVDGAPATAVGAAPDVPTGVFVDGVDVSRGAGSGWTYDFGKSNLTFHSAAEHVLSGTNVNGMVDVVAHGGSTLVMSNLCLSGLNTFRAEGPVALRGEGASSLSSPKRYAVAGDGVVTVERGTFWLKGPTEPPVNVLGGSIRFDGTADVAFSNGTERVWRVTVGGFASGAAVDITGIGGYDATRLVADDEGSVCLWLPDGDYAFYVHGEQYDAKVEGADTEAVSHEYALSTHVTIDGVDAIKLSGAGWEYDPATSNAVFGTSGLTHVVGGQNAEGRVMLVATNDVTLVLSNLYLAAKVPLTANGDVVLRGKGTNLLISDDGLGLFKGTNSVTVAGGTFTLIGDVSVPVVVTGGSVQYSGEADPAFSNLTERVSCVTVGGLPSGDAIDAIAGIGAYGMEGVVADKDGNVYLWLPDGEYDLECGAKKWHAVVEGTNTVAQMKSLLLGFSASSGGVSLTVPKSMVSAALTKKRALLLAAAAPEEREVRIYASPVLPFPRNPRKIDISECAMKDNDDGTVTITVELGGDAPQMFYRIEK